MKLGKIFLFSIFAIIFQISNAQILQYSNEFLKIGATARGIALGNSIITSANASEAVYYNPANTANLKNLLDISFTHSEYFGDLANFDYAAAVVKNNNLYFGFALMRLAVDNIPNTLFIYNNGTFDLEQISYFNASNNALFFTLAIQNLFVPGLKLGAKAKIIYNHLGDFVNGYGFGFDIAASYQIKNYWISAVIRDITGTFTAWFYNLNDSIIHVLQQTGNNIPKNSVEILTPSLVLGISRKFTLNENLDALSEISLVIEPGFKNNYIINSKILSASPQIGTELIFKKVLFVRFGFYNMQKIRYFTDSTEIVNQVNIFPCIGLGLRYKDYFVDYTYQNPLNKAIDLQSHFITLRVLLGRKSEE